LIGCLFALSVANAAPLQKKPAVAKPAAPPPYVDKTLDYAVQLPAGWTRATEVPAPAVAFRGPLEKNFAVNVVIDVHGVPVERNQEARFVEQVKKDFKTMATMTPLRKTRLAGLPAYTWLAHLRVPQARGIENRQFLFFHKRRAYKITFSYPVSVRKKYAPTFDKILASFRLTK
jgi:hypothetical protein